MLFKRLLLSATVIASLIGAFIIGRAAGKIISEKKLLSQRENIYQPLLSLRKGIVIGDTLPNIQLIDLALNAVNVRDLVKNGVVICFIHPDCESCHEELSLLTKMWNHDRVSQHFIFVSDENPLLLRDLQGTYGIALPIYYDHQGSFRSTMEVMTFPLNIVVNRSFVIESIIPGTLLQSEISQLSKN